jgi:hypothetical protein
MGPGKWQIDVYAVGDGGDLYHAVDHESGDTVGVFYNEGGPWWRVRGPSGTERGMYVQRDVKEPWRDIVERMVGG